MKPLLVTAAIATSLLLFHQSLVPDVLLAQDEGTYVVRVTNLTKAQSFTPIIAASHTPAARIFLAGTLASSELRTVAEEGNVEPLRALLEGMAAVQEVVSSAGLLTRGATSRLEVEGGGAFSILSLVAMLIPTNDAFVGVTTMLPDSRETKVVYAYAYDAGTEQNDELCASIPGPFFNECGGPGGGGQAGNGEGVVTIHPGIHGIGDLPPSDRDWRNPVARITIRNVS